MSVQFTILGSGSSGNCAYLETPEARLLIDAGLSGRQIRQRLLSIARTPENLTGILITHEHHDHIQGLAVLAAKLNVPIYCNRLTKEAIELFVGAPVRCNLFTTGGSFDVNDVRVDTFSVPHDAYDPVGFLLSGPAPAHRTLSRRPQRKSRRRPMTCLFIRDPAWCPAISLG